MKLSVDEFLLVQQRASEESQRTATKDIYRVQIGINDARKKIEELRRERVADRSYVSFDEVQAILAFVGGAR